MTHWRRLGCKCQAVALLVLGVRNDVAQTRISAAGDIKLLGVIDSAEMRVVDTRRLIQRQRLTFRRRQPRLRHSIILAVSWVRYRYLDSLDPTKTLMASREIQAVLNRTMNQTSGGSSHTTLNGLVKNRFVRSVHAGQSERPTLG